VRGALLSCIAWLGALQSWIPVTPSISTFPDAARLLGVASVLGTLTVLVYRLGVWRQEMENTKNNVAAEVKAHRDESTANLGRIERRLEAIDHLLALASDERLRAARSQTRIERRLERLEERHVLPPPRGLNRAKRPR
jgi:hypothetical protein